MYEHAKEQARINAVNFERNREVRERAQLALRKRYDADDDDSP